MKYSGWLLGIAGAIGIASGCGGNDPPPVLDSVGAKPSTLGGRHSGGTAGASPASGGADAQGGAGDAGAAGSSRDLKVTISSPPAASDPNKDEVLVTDKVTVICAVDGRSAGLRVDPSAVTLAVLDDQGAEADGLDGKPLRAPGVPTGNPDEYSAVFSLGSIATGVVSFRCSAKALQAEASGFDTVSTFVDHGPTIVAKLPELDSAHPLKGVVPVEFTVTPTPLANGDLGAAVDRVKLQVAGVEIVDVTEDPNNRGTWRAGVDFKDPFLFPQQPPEHTSVHIEAANVRRPKAVTAITDYPIVVDGKGPNIAYVSPRDNATVHGDTVVTFTASDSGAGLDIDTLSVTITGRPLPVKFNAADKAIWTRKGDTFTYRFDRASLLNVESQITVSIRAQDNAGNLTDAVTLLLYADDEPPAIDLDPGNARTRDLQNVCSASFDPLGESLNDGQKTNVRLNLLRALVYDIANSASGVGVRYFSGTDRSSVRMYAQADPSKPFLVDANKDGICDSLAREDFPYQSLSPIKKAGQPEYSKTDFGTAPSVDSGGAACTLKEPSTPPPRLCADHKSDLWMVVQHDLAIPQGDEPVVYGIGGLKEPECTGSLWDLGLIPGANDWLCLAVRASDNLGNVGISRPLRVCFDNPDVPGAPPCASGSPPPSCTDSCAPPPRFRAKLYELR